MFGDQTPSYIVWWSNMLMLKWVAKRLKHVWSNTDETIDTSRRASVERMRASNMFDTRLSKRTKHHPSNTRTKRNYLRSDFDQMFDGLQSNCIKHNQTWLSTIKHDQTAPEQGVQMVNCLFTKQWLMVLGRQTAFIVCPGPKFSIKCLMAIKFYQTRENKISYDQTVQTARNKVSKR